MAQLRKVMRIFSLASRTFGRSRRKCKRRFAAHDIERDRAVRDGVLPRRLDRPRPKLAAFKAPGCKFKLRCHQNDVTVLFPGPETHFDVILPLSARLPQVICEQAFSCTNEKCGGAGCNVSARSEARRRPWLKSLGDNDGGPRRVALSNAQEANVADRPPLSGPVAMLV